MNEAAPSDNFLSFGKHTYLDCGTWEVLCQVKYRKLFEGGSQLCFRALLHCLQLAREGLHESRIIAD